MIKVSPFEIREFLSLNDLNEFLEREIVWYESFYKGYSDKLGSLLREEGLSSDEVEKILREKGLARGGKGGGKEKKGRKERAASSGEWFDYKGLMFSADKQGKAEMLFELTENAEKVMNRMREVKMLVEELQKTGFGHGLSFLVYLVDGVPERIYVQKAESSGQKYRLELFLSTSMTQPENEEAEEKEEEESNRNEEEEIEETSEGSGEDLTS